MPFIRTKLELCKCSNPQGRLPDNPWVRRAFLVQSIYAVVFVDFWPDVSHEDQEVIQDFIPVLPEVGLEDGHLLGLLLHLGAGTAMEF
jgi:hypothetical protein